MKYKILENPNCEDAYGLIEEALRKRATITIYACCKVNYEGRALSELNWGERINPNKTRRFIFNTSGKKSRACKLATSKIQNKRIYPGQ